MKVQQWLAQLVLQVVLGLCGLFILKTIWSIYSGYTSSQNPLIPEELGHYIAFPNVIFAFIYASIGYIAYRLLRERHFDFKFVYPFAFLILFEIGKVYIFAILQEINPFG